jgi:hypothetical protein
MAGGAVRQLPQRRTRAAQQNPRLVIDGVDQDASQPDRRSIFFFRKDPLPAFIDIR